MDTLLTNMSTWDGPTGPIIAYNIIVVLDLPMVGQFMSDNPMNAIYVPSPNPVEVSLIQVVGITRSRSYIEAASGEILTGGGPRMFGTFFPQMAKQRLPDAVGIAVTDIFFLIGHQLYSITNATLRGGYLLEKIMGPVSTGHLELRNRNPNDKFVYLSRLSSVPNADQHDFRFPVNYRPAHENLWSSSWQS
ncbi:hypothetical protein QQ045_020502 [Rhodiola kirilowii]